MELGLVLAGGMPPSTTIQVARDAESAGWPSVWVTEGAGGDAFALLSVIGVRTSTIRLGTAVVSIFVRSLPLLAMAACTVQDLSGGRLQVGIGISHPEQVEFEHGERYERPLERLHDAVAAIRSAGQCGSVAEAGLRGPALRAFRLAFQPPASLTPVLIAAIGPRMSRLGWELSDGIIQIWRRPEELAIVSGSRRGSRRLLAVIHTATASNEGEAARSLERARQRYASRFGRYRRLFERQAEPPGIHACDASMLGLGLQAYADAGVDDLLLLAVDEEGMAGERATRRLMETVAARDRGYRMDPTTATGA